MLTYQTTPPPPENPPPLEPERLLLRLPDDEPEEEEGWVAVEAQAIDRCYRIGQDKHVNAYKLVCRDNVEEKIIALQEQKKKLADGLILDEAKIMKSLRKEELLKLFE